MIVDKIIRRLIGHSLSFVTLLFSATNVLLQPVISRATHTPFIGRRIGINTWLHASSVLLLPTPHRIEPIPHASCRLKNTLLPRHVYLNSILSFLTWLVGQPIGRRFFDLSSISSPFRHRVGSYPATVWCIQHLHPVLTRSSLRLL